MIDAEHLPMVGRRTAMVDLTEAVATNAGGRTVLVTVSGPHGSGISRVLSEAAAMVTGIAPTTVELHPADAHSPGLLSERLGLERHDPSAEPLIVDGIQWADPTSLGILQSAVLDRPGRLVVLGGSDIAGPQLAGLERLAAAVARDGSVHRIEIGPLTADDLEEIAAPDDAVALVMATGGSPRRLGWLLEKLGDDVELVDGRLRGQLPEELPHTSTERAMADLAPAELKLVEAVALAGRPVPLAVAATVADVSPDDMLDHGDRLSRLGLLSQSKDGYTPASQAQAREIREQVGEVRAAALTQSLADGFASVGAADQTVGTFRLQAGQWQEAFDLLSRAGLDAAGRGHLIEALPALNGALTAYAEIEGDDPELAGRLHLARAKANLLAGELAEAAADADHAVHHLRGAELVDALQWAGRIADDRQHPQLADTYVALAQLEAEATHSPEEMAELHSSRARSLGEIGFPDESDASLAKAEALAPTADDAIRAQVRFDKARIAFDQGRMRDAASELDVLAEAIPESEPGVLADAESWLARARIYAGDVAAGMNARDRALQRADTVGALEPVFQAHLALAEAGALYGRWEEGAHGAREALGVALQHMPAWENAARYLLARNLFGAGDLSGAKAEIDRALLACPAGIDGWRWRNRCRALKWEIDTAGGEKWPAQEATDLTEELLAARFYLQAVDLLTARARHEKDSDLGEHAAALALRIGVPMAAIRAVEAGNGWNETEGAAAAGAARALTTEVPVEWREDWESLPEVKAALGAREIDDAEAGEAADQIQQRLAQVFEESGLEVTDNRLSPAQRHAAGKRIKRPKHVVARRRLATLGSAAVIALIAGVGGAFAAGVFDEPDVTIINNTGPTTTTVFVPPPIEEVQLDFADDPSAGLGNWVFRGDDDDAVGSNRGYSDRSGVPEVAGFYWKFPTNDPVDASPIIRGDAVYVGSANETFYGIDTGRGTAFLTVDTGGIIDAPASFGTGEVGEAGGSEPLIFFGSRDGNVYAYQASTAAQLWVRQVSPAGAGPTFSIGDKVFALTNDGLVVALNSRTGDEVWRFPAEGEASDLGELSQPPAYADGTLYVAGEGGRLVALNVEDGSQRCTRDLQAPVRTSPMIDEGTLYVGAGPVVWILSPGCQLVGQRVLSEFNVGTTPIIHDDSIYVGAGPLMIRFDLLDPGIEDFPVRTNGTIQSSPVIAGGIMYFGSDDRNVYAYDLDAGEVLWTFETGGEVRSTPAVGTGVIYVGSRDGVIYALGGLPEEDSGS